MHPRLAELLDLLSRERDALLALVARIPTERRQARPADGQWSVAEVVDHLATVESGTARLLARRLERAREAGLGPETATDSVLDRLAHVDVVRGPARVAPEIVLPRGDVSLDEALAALARSREALLAVLRDGDGLALEQVTARHAVLGELDLYQWALFVAQHERRHALQIARVAGAPSEATPAS